MMSKAIFHRSMASVHLSLLLLLLATGAVAFSHPNVPTTAVELPGDFPLRADVERALAAVRRACSVTEQLQPVGGNDPQEINTVEKKDLSPVTVADFAVQALILDALHEEYPNDGYIAEEDSASLLHDAKLCSEVMDAIGFSSKERTIKAIDLGKSFEKWEVGSETTPRPRRVWCLDPIDGTRGFLRGRRPGGQYAIALALIEDGVPVIGILGCPNLPVDDVGDSGSYAWSDDEEAVHDPMHRGCVFVASKNGGSFQLPVTSGAFVPRRLHVTKDRPVSLARFCIGVERFSDAAGQCTGMAQELHGAEKALDVEHGDIVLATRMDSQAKHGVIARGGAELYARLPKPGYVEWIWDHAAGKVVVEEAGGRMTDVDGRELDFSLGAHLSSSVKGVLMSCGGETHQALVKAYAAVSSRPPSN